ncbi:putative Fe-containing alcohol dehydrogenase [Xylariaceae sp. FL1019]|nr:putative Fe-containing alcohol dehydrogenase [Xylariaceae sp. FL1019]
MTETLHPAFPNQPTPLLSYGLPFTEAILKHTKSTHPSERSYVICSASLAKNTSHLDALKQALGPQMAGLRVGMRSHSHWSDILEVVQDARHCNADCIITLGAGSLTDAAKVISLALANSITTESELETLLPDSSSTRAQVFTSQIPIICIPTSLSGGEYSSFAGATRDSDGRKYVFRRPEIKGPSLVILDPVVAMTTPDSIWLSSGVRALDHCIETLCALGSNEAADETARNGLRKLIPGLLRAKSNRDDQKATLDCFLGSVDAMGAAVSGVPLGASHGIGNQLGPVGVGHGETSCILNPAVCKYNYKKRANIERQDATAGILWEDPAAAAIFEEKGLSRESSDLGDLMDAIIRALGMPRSLKQFGVKEDQLDGIAENSLKHIWVQSNPAPLDKQGVLEILTTVLDES